MLCCETAGHIEIRRKFTARKPPEDNSVDNMNYIILYSLLLKKMTFKTRNNYL
jgi:hypothetical protein